MNKVVAILGFVVTAGYSTPDASWAHRHILGPPEGERRSFMTAEHDQFIGPIPMDQGLLQRTEQPSWDRFSLTHTDTIYLPGSERHHPAAYRSFNMADGVALMFSWPFSGMSTFWIPPEGSSNEPTLKQDHPR